MAAAPSTDAVHVEEGAHLRIERPPIVALQYAPYNDDGDVLPRGLVHEELATEDIEVTDGPSVLVLPRAERKALARNREVSLRNQKVVEMSNVRLKVSAPENREGLLGGVRHGKIRRGLSVVMHHVPEKVRKGRPEKGLLVGPELREGEVVPTLLQLRSGGSREALRVRIEVLAVHVPVDDIGGTEAMEIDPVMKVGDIGGVAIESDKAATAGVYKIVEGGKDVGFLIHRTIFENYLSHILPMCQDIS